MSYLSAIESCSTAGPKNSTNFSTTPLAERRNELRSYKSEGGGKNYEITSESLGDSKHQIGSSGVSWELASEFVSDYFGQDHRDGLVEHDALSFNTTDTPTNHTET